MRQVVHVQSACRHVGGHEQLGAVLAELLHRQIALLLAQVAVQGIGIVSVAYQVVGHLLRLHFGAAEDDGIDAGKVIDHALQGEVFVSRVYHIIYVVHILGSLVAAAHLYLPRFPEILPGDALYLTAHGGGEEQRAVLLGHSAQDGVDVLLKTHGEHLVSLVQHDVAHRREVGRPTVHQVDEATGSSHYHVHSVLQGTYLRLDVGSAIDGQDACLRQMLGKALHIIGYLQAQLARGSHDEQADT